MLHKTFTGSGIRLATTSKKHCRKLLDVTFTLNPNVHIQKQFERLMRFYDTIHRKLQLDIWCQHKTASLRAVVPAAVHQTGGATAMVDVSSCVPVVNNTYERRKILI